MMALVAAADDGVWQRTNAGSIAGVETGAPLAGLKAPLAAPAGPDSRAGSPLTVNDVNKPTPPSTVAHGIRIDHEGTNPFMRPSNITTPCATTANRSWARPNV
jgi:hypothetical protein